MIINIIIKILTNIYKLQKQREKENAYNTPISGEVVILRDIGLTS